MIVFGRPSGRGEKQVEVAAGREPRIHLKTIVAATSPWVRIPRPPLTSANVPGRPARYGGSGRDGRRTYASGHDPVSRAPLRPGNSSTTFSAESTYLMADMLVEILRDPGR